MANIKEIKHVDSTTIVSVTGEINMHYSPLLHDALVELCTRKPQRMIVDLTEVSYIDSSGVGTLVEIYRRLKGHKGRLVLCGLSAMIRSVLEITKLEQIFIIRETQQEALEA